MTTTKRVLIAGAGPGGILAAIHLLRRNAKEDVNYEVTLVDAGRDYGKLTSTELPSHRSWMIGLASHGLTAIREVPDLFENYVKEIGIALTSLTICIGSTSITNTTDVNDIGQGGGENFIVDRNYVVASLARYLNEVFGNDAAFSALYDTKILFVDAANKRVLARNTKDFYLDYDILLGCDGVRSVVRGAFVLSHRDFECKIADIFVNFKAVHVARPKKVNEASISLLPSCLPHMNGIALPEKGDMVNISAGYNLNAPCDPDLASNDPKVVAEYVKKHFKAFELEDYDDFARQWVGQSWNTTGQVHCNYYHSDKLSAIIMGDAAHATSPSIGMGMNTALGDASALNRLLDQYEDDWDAVLPAFSKERVKEGRALTDLAFFLFSMSPTQQIRNLVIGIIRGAVSKIVPFVWNDPQYYIGQGEKLSVVYDRATKMGILPSVRKTNESIIRAHFEKEAGMVTAQRGKWIIPTLVLLVMLLAVVAVFAHAPSGAGKLI
jgi:kynurenine 3-monooxygenase